MQSRWSIIQVNMCSFSLTAVGDTVAMQSALERYEEIDYTFSGSREGKLLKARAALCASAIGCLWRLCSIAPTRSCLCSPAWRSDTWWDWHCLMSTLVCPGPVRGV